MNLQTKFDLLTTKQTERMLLQSHRNYYEHGEKAGCLLKHQQKHQAAPCVISQKKTLPVTRCLTPLISMQHLNLFTPLFTNQIFRLILLSRTGLLTI